MLKQLTAIFVVDGGRHVLVFVFYNRLLAYTVQVGGFILKLFNSIQFNSIQFNCIIIVVDGGRYERNICRGEPRRRRRRREKDFDWLGSGF
jgi:hypothetical protein